MASSSRSLPSSPAGLVESPSKSMSPNNARPAHRARPPKPNYKHIHRFPLPLDVHPLPPLIPHNPLSLISVVLSYLTYFISPPHQETYAAYFDSATSSVHVTDHKAIQALWEMGFFGKGIGGQTNEELTRQRRTERRELKLERARMEKVAIEKRLKAEETLLLVVQPLHSKSFLSGKQEKLECSNRGVPRSRRTKNRLPLLLDKSLPARQFAFHLLFKRKNLRRIRQLYAFPD